MLLISKVRVDQLKQEACRGYERLCNDGNSILPHLRKDSSVRPPYTVTQITESALRRETQRIHRLANEDTSQIYDIGVAPVRADEGSWVVRWLLWNTIKMGGNRDVCDETGRTLICESAKGCRQALPSAPQQLPNTSNQEFVQG